MLIKTVDELEIGACKYWPKELSKKAAEISLLMPLLETQDAFINLLKSANSDPYAWKSAIKFNKDLSPNLFLKHLMVISDVGGERIQRFSKDFKSIFPNGKLIFNFLGNRECYTFKKDDNMKWSNKKLHVEKSLLLNPLSEFTDEMLDVCVLLIWGSNALDKNFIPDEILEKCVIGDLIGKPHDLDDFIKQRYLFVSRQTGGSTANDLGYACEAYIKEKLMVYLPDNYSLDGHTLTNVSQSNDNKLTKFDLVVANSITRKCIGIEVSFQVTTNSVIERKSQNANDRQRLAHQYDHKVAYIIDGSGNFQRKSAIQRILNYSDFTVNFSDENLKKLANFIRNNI